MREFQISTKHTGPKRVIKVMVYESRARLQRAARKRDGFYRDVSERSWYDKTAALTNCLSLAEIKPDGTVVAAKPYITIRLAQDALGERPTEIIAHEATHAAVYLYQHDVQKTIPNLEKEEILCYLVGDITRKVVNKLYEHSVL